MTLKLEDFDEEAREAIILDNSLVDLMDDINHDIGEYLVKETDKMMMRLSDK